MRASHGPRSLLVALSVSWLLGLSGLAAFSGYSPFPPPGAYVDLRVATMLTPIGIVENLVLKRVPEGQPDLAPYYSQPVSRAGMHEQPLVLVAYLVTAASAIALFLRWRPFR